MAFEFWFEFASTYSYLTALRIEQVARESGVEVEYRPFLLGPIFKDQGLSDSPFNVYPIKGRYMWRDLEREALALGAAFRRPSVFPRNGLVAARVAVVVDDLGESARYVPAVFRAEFEADADISKPEVIAGILGELGLDALAILERSNTDAIKQRLRAQTERARELGVFGAPSFVIAGELFWGNDRLGQALAWARKS